MRDQLDKTLERFEGLERDMVDPVVLADPSRLAAIAREHGGLAKVANLYRSFLGLCAAINEAREMAAADDPDMREIAEAELPELVVKREAAWDILLGMSLGGEDANRSRCIMELRAGTGGDEAALFARDLYEMYKRHADMKGWKVEVLDSSVTELGGFKELSIAVEGEGVFRELRYESGGHRVQRVPKTETQGRIHTSAATVAVMAEPEDVEVEIGPDDYRLDKFCASGPGGQHVNKTESAVRLTHLETGIVVQCQDEKSQHKNLAKALRVLKSRVYDMRQQAEHARRSAERRDLVGSGDRSERIRTYNYPDNRLTDHRIGLSLYKLDQILAGNVQMVTDALIDYERQHQRDQMGGLD
ncbi:MAG: peptide chain release factor 1 [Lacipirellulaceae bacterium]